MPWPVSPRLGVRLLSLNQRPLFCPVWEGWCFAGCVAAEATEDHDQQSVEAQSVYVLNSRQVSVELKGSKDKF